MSLGSSESFVIMVSPLFRKVNLRDLNIGCSRLHKEQIGCNFFVVIHVGIVTKLLFPFHPFWTLSIYPMLLGRTLATNFNFWVVQCFGTSPNHSTPLSLYSAYFRKLMCRSPRRTRIANRARHASPLRFFWI